MEKVEIDKKQVLLGSLLGDGYIEYAHNNFYYREKHGPKQQDYLIWKSKLLPLETKYSEYVSYDKRQRQDGSCYGFYRYCCIRSKASPQLKKSYILVYQDNHGLSRMLDKLKVVGLLIWYLDDGSYSYYHNVISVALKRRTLKHYNTIKRWFREQHGIFPKLHKKKTYFYFSVSDSKRLVASFQPYISQVPKCMHYKFGLDEEQAIRDRKKRIRSHQQWLLQNPGYKKEYNRKYRQKHKKRLNRLRRKYYQAHKEELKTYAWLYRRWQKRENP